MNRHGLKVFKGQDGTFAVSQDGDRWKIQKIHASFSYVYAVYSGVSVPEAVHPRHVDVEHGGSFSSLTNALHTARKWAGVSIMEASSTRWNVEDHPVPNRRAAIAHTKALA